LSRAKHVPPSAIRGAIRALPPVLWPIVKRLPAYLRLGWALARDRSIPRRYKAALLASALYSVSPAQIAVGMIPVVGQLDTVAFFLYGLRIALKHCPSDVRSRYLKRVHLPEEQLDDDLDKLVQAGARVARAVGERIFEELRFAGRIGVGFSKRMVGRIVGPRRA
jgi:uncharacterized membrane protein YkvA (DUF1232 family)